ncbi:MAG TPA: class I SAM-dependent methyltransferase [Gammaproteobacteria bacterium]
MRLNHAILDRESREKKATKIIRIIESRKSLKGTKVLEIGTGSGVTAAVLAEEVGEAGAVYAIDIKDQRVVHEGYDFREVAGTALPFQDGEFDVVISNHVIEHVGSRPDQLHHLAEIKRVMKANALLYLAVPNKWRLVEPHYKIPILSWMPQQVADLVVRASGKNEEFDCKSPSRWELRRLFSQSGFIHEELDREALRIVGEIEGSRAAEFMSRLPKLILSTMLLIVPTFIVTARKRR